MTCPRCWPASLNQDALGLRRPGPVKPEEPSTEDVKPITLKRRLLNTMGFTKTPRGGRRRKILLPPVEARRGGRWPWRASSVDVPAGFSGGIPFCRRPWMASSSVIEPPPFGVVRDLLVHGLDRGITPMLNQAARELLVSNTTEQLHRTP